MAALNLSEAIFNPNSVLYINVNKTLTEATEGSSGGLSTGAVAGIVVGACCGLGLLAAAGLVVVKRRRRQGQTHAGPQEEGKSGEKVRHRWHEDRITAHANPTDAYMHCARMVVACLTLTNSHLV